MTVSTKKATSPVRDFLGEFALAVHRYLIYPPDHPLLEENAQKVVRVLAPVEPPSGQVEITVAGNRLLIASDPEAEGPKHSDLASKLRDMGIGGIGIDPSAAVQDLQALLEFLSARSKSAETSLEPGTAVPGTNVVEVRPISLGGLEISWDDDEEDDSDRLSQLWIALDNAVGQFQEDRPWSADAAGATSAEGGEQGTGGDGAELVDSEEAEADSIERLAGGVRSSSSTPSGSALAVGYLRQLLTAVGNTPKGQHASTIRRRLGGLISALDPDTIRKLAAAAGQRSDQAAFVADVSVLGDEAVAKVLKAVSNQSAKSLTESMARLFGKMSRQSKDDAGRTDPETQRALRRSLLALLKEWSLEDPNPEDYGSALESISRTMEAQDSDWGLGGGREPERILKMSIELETFGGLAERAAEYLLFQSEQGITDLMALIDGQDENNPAVVEISRILYEPERILVLADAEDVEESTLTSFVDRLGNKAIPPLLEVIAAAESRTVRRKVFDALVALGADAAEAALNRLPDERWYVTRNLLSLARKAGYHFAWFDPEPYLNHGEPTIRREAYLLAYLDPKRRTNALESALIEEDDRIVTAALAELERGVPSVVASTLAGWIAEGVGTESRRISVIRALDGSRSPEVLESLVEASIYKTRFLRRRKLRKEMAIVTATLTALRSNWSRNPKAIAVLSMAKKSKIAQYMEIVEGME
ncbi:MAG: hypothetical protein ACR2QM_11645 [Longimicrobiales bacterium]